MRDKRYPCHQDVMDAILGWGAHGPYHRGEELNEGLGRALDVTPAMQAEQFKPNKGHGIWQNYVAHGLKRAHGGGGALPGRQRLLSLDVKGQGHGATVAPLHPEMALTQR